jgi:hypothetical protein
MNSATFILGLIGTLTGSLALYIHWLTYRRDSARLRLEDSRKEQASEPLFDWRGGGANHASAINRLQVHRDFTNEGGAVTDLEIKAKGDIQAAILPKGHIGEHGSGRIELSIAGVNVMPEVAFEISYVTRLGRQSSQFFVWPQNAGPKRVKDKSTQ